MNTTKLLPNLDLNCLNPERFIVYRRCDQIDAAMNGVGDIDILIDPSFLNELRGILLRIGGIQAFPSDFHDNRTRSREEWFVPVAGSVGPVHLDVVTELLAGPRYNKTLHLSSFGEVGTSPYLTKDGVRIKVADQTCLVKHAIAKEAFRQFLLPRSTTVLGILSEVNTTIGAATPWGEITCNGRDCRISGAILTRCRSALLFGNEYSTLRTVKLWSRHYLRKLLHFLQRSLEIAGLLHSPKRAFVSGGSVIAIIGPDGAGKSTQVRRLQTFFSAKFGTRLEYLGHSGQAARIARSFSQSKKVGAQENNRPTEDPSVKHHFEDAARSAWGIWLACYRLTRVKKARRLARSGYLVFSDRWPQNVERGLMDGPVRRVTRKTFMPFEFLFSVEESLYDRIDRIRPDLRLHLTLPYKVAEERKPGELTEANFDRRVQLMKLLRDQDPQIIAIDASQEHDQVFTNLLGQVWGSLQSARGPQEKG